MSAPSKTGSTSWQPTFEDLGRALRDTTFVVVDLETTGASIRDGSAITEIGAVKVRGGEIVAVFQTFVNPNAPIPAFITVLTGITDAMVLHAPPIAEAFPTFLEFCGSKEETVLVAHNAPFDLGFLKGAAAQLGYSWPNYPVLDTARIARLVLAREEVRDCKLSTLSKFFGTEVTPNHRALDDAKATVEVLHGLLERLGSLGVSTLEDLQGFTNRVTPEQRRKKHLADGIPAVAGVYIFRDSAGEALYIGTSRNLKTRVRNYFGSGETRRRIRDMVSLAERVDIIECATIIEAQIRELRLISEKQPRFNRRSRSQEKAVWIKLTNEPFPRLSSVRGTKGLNHDDGWTGPFNGLTEAAFAIEAIHEVVPLRQCTKKIPLKVSPRATSCALFDMGKCGAPCIGQEDSDQYQAHSQKARHLIHTNSAAVQEKLMAKMNLLSQDERFEEAGEFRNRLSSFIKGSARGQRINALTLIPHLVAAFPVPDASGVIKKRPNFEFICIRFGRLAGSAISKSNVAISQTISSLVETSERVIPSLQVLPASSYEEIEKLLGYLDRPGIRIVEIEGEWALPTFGSGSFYDQLATTNSQWQSFTGND